MAEITFVPAAEAAFIAGLSDKEIHRVVDENIVRSPLVQLDNGRRFVRLVAALARFYCDFDEILTGKARRYAIDQVVKRVASRSDGNEILTLAVSPSVMDWDVPMNTAHVDLAGFVAAAQVRASQVDLANRLVVEDPLVMGGVAVVKGTRLPAETVVARLRAGESVESLREDYPSLSSTQIQAAEIYVAVHPRRGRPPKNSGPPEGWKLVSSKVVRPARRA